MILPDGGRLRLRAVRVGRAWRVKPEWFDEFVADQTAAFLDTTDAPTRTPAEARRASEQAAKELELAGV